jgi:hypothetical protein
MIEPEPDTIQSSKDGELEYINGSEDSTCKYHTLLCDPR